MNTFLIYIPIIITVLMVLFIFIKQYRYGVDFGDFFSISIIFVSVISIFIFFSDSWSYKRWLNRLYFPSYSMSGELSKILPEGYWSNVEVKTILNVVVVKYKTDENLTDKDLREYDRKLTQLGGIETLKNIKISELVKHEKILDYLQQGIELNYLHTNKNNELTNFVITYEDIKKYWLSNKK